MPLFGKFCNFAHSTLQITRAARLTLKQGRSPKPAALSPNPHPPLAFFFLFFLSFLSCTTNRFFFLRLTRHLDATYATDNPRITKSYENAVAFFVFVVCVCQKKVVTLHPIMLEDYIIDDRLCYENHYLKVAQTEVEIGGVAGVRTLYSGGERLRRTPERARSYAFK